MSETRSERVFKKRNRDDETRVSSSFGSERLYSIRTRWLSLRSRPRGRICVELALTCVSCLSCLVPHAAGDSRTPRAFTTSTGHGPWVTQYIGTVPKDHA